MSQSSDFPVTDDAFQKVKNGAVYVEDPQQHADFYTHDAIFAILNPDGSDLLYSTYIGGDYGEFIMGVELIDGGVILQFRTYSDDLWVSENAYQKVKGNDLYNPSIPYIGTIYEDYYANRTIYDMDTYVASYLFPNMKSNLVIDAPDVEKYFSGTERFVVTVKDKDGNPLSNQSVLFTINGENYTRNTNENGTATFPLNLNSGIYNVTTTVENTTVTSVVNILSTVNGTDIVKIFRNGTQYYATFRDGEGNYLANGTTVKFNINGVLYERKVNGDKGLAKLNINLYQGDYVITTINTKTGEYLANNVTVLPSIVENKDITKFFKNATQYTVKVLGADGNPAGAGEVVTFNINGVLYNRTTDANGIAKMNINLAAGKYVITADYNGCRVSNNITVLSVLSAKDLTKKFGAEDQFVATLVDGQGKAFSGKTVTFNINGILYDRTTNSDGQAKLNIKLMPGKYIITSSYDGCNIANTVKVE